MLGESQGPWSGLAVTVLSVLCVGVSHHTRIEISKVCGCSGLVYTIPQTLLSYLHSECTKSVTHVSIVIHTFVSRNMTLEPNQDQ